MNSERDVDPSSREQTAVAPAAQGQRVSKDGSSGSALWKTVKILLLDWFPRYAEIRSRARNARRSVSLELRRHTHSARMPINTKTFRGFTNQFLKITSQSRNKNQLTSCDFNLFSLLPVNENRHSAILGALLDPNSEHGQGAIFLSTFLHMLGIEYNLCDCWGVQVGKSYVDITIKRLSPRSVIIIENKCWKAGDQPNQLYKYWYKEIYLPRKTSRWITAEPNDDRIVYLAPSPDKQPTDQSLRRPTDWGEDEPPSIPWQLKPELKPRQWIFKKDVVDWLNASLRKLTPTNYRMIEFIKQYIEYWR